MSEWKIKSLSTIMSFSNGKKRPNENGIIPIYGGNGILGYANSYNYENCVIVGRVGVYCGSVNYEKSQCWVSDNAIATLPLNDNDIRFIYYLLKNLHLNERRIGTSQPLLTQSILNNIKCYIPEIYVQRKIASILSAIDDKIELNTAINDNLVQQAQAIFKAWFVDFLPFGGVMPYDWRMGTVSEIIELHDSKRVPLSGAERDKMQKIYPYYGATSQMDYVDDYLFDGIYLLLGEDGTVINSNGFPILQYVYGKFWVNNHAHIITGKLGYSVESLYLLFSMTNIKSIVTGAVQQKVSQANLKKIPVIIPDIQSLEQFNTTIQPIFSAIRNYRDENQRLSALRDTLLPKLMNGEIDVSAVRI